MKKKYLPLYYEWMESAWIANNGLCNSIDGPTQVKLFKPDKASSRYDYWAYDGDNTNIFERAQRFTTLRQNIVLFLACMANEY